MADLISRAAALDAISTECGCGMCARRILDVPAVDTIPMWWITEKFLDVLNKDKELSKAVWLVRKAWLKEQEAQK